MSVNTLLCLESNLQELTLYEACLESDSPGGAVAKIFEENPLLPGIILMEKGEFFGMISRRIFFENLSRPHSLELFHKRPLLTLYRFSQSDILILESDTPIVAAVRHLLQRPAELIHEPIVVRCQPNTYRILDVHQLLLAQLQIHELTTVIMRESEAQLRQQAQQLERALSELQRTQTQLIHTEKMSSLGQLVAGVAHEINNPISFIYGNLPHAEVYIKGLLQILSLYQHHYPHTKPEIQEKSEEIELDYLKEDLPKLLKSMQDGAERIRQLVLSLRNFCRLDEAQMKKVNIHEGLDNTLMILQKQLKERCGTLNIVVEKDYGELPLVECYAGQLNQVFMNILSNAIDALEERYCQWKSKNKQGKDIFNHPQKIDSFSTGKPGNDLSLNPAIPTIFIGTKVIHSNCISIKIVDNGMGITDDVMMRLFDPFFTTKPVGSGTGLGLSISYEIIVNQHGGELKCFSEPEKGAEFVIEIPIRQSHSPFMLSPLA